MAGGSAARGDDRGGGIVEASRPSRARVATAVAALAAAVSLAVYAAVASDLYGGPVAVVGGAGVVAALTAVVLGWTSAVPAAVVLLGSEYVLGLATGGFDDELDPAAPLVAGGLLLLAELAYWSIELRGPGREERPVLLRRLGAVCFLAVMAVALGSFVVVATAAPLGGGLVWDVVGVAAAAATLAVVALLARRDVQG